MQAKLLKAEKLGGQLKVNMLLSAAPAILNRVVRLLHKDLSVEIKETRERRSLEQNAKAWALMGEMANILGANKDDVYLEMLRRYGQSVIVTTKKNIPLDRVFKYYEKLKDGLSNGREMQRMAILKDVNRQLLDKQIETVEKMGIPDEQKQRALTELRSAYNNIK